MCSIAQNCKSPALHESSKHQPDFHLLRILKTSKRPLAGFGDTGKNACTFGQFGRLKGRGVKRDNAVEYVVVARMGEVGTDVEAPVYSMVRLSLREMRVAGARFFTRPKHTNISARRFDLMVNSKLSLAGFLLVAILLIFAFDQRCIMRLTKTP